MNKVSKYMDWKNKWSASMGAYNDHIESAHDERTYIMTAAFLQSALLSKKFLCAWVIMFATEESKICFSCGKQTRILISMDPETTADDSDLAYIIIIYVTVKISSSSCQSVSRGFRLSI